MTKVKLYRNKDLVFHKFLVSCINFHISTSTFPNKEGRKEGKTFFLKWRKKRKINDHEAERDESKVRIRWRSSAPVPPKIICNAA